MKIKKKIAGLAFLSLMLGSGIFPAFVEGEKDHLPTQGQLNTCLKLLAQKNKLTAESNRLMDQYGDKKKNCNPLPGAEDVTGLPEPLVMTSASNEACFANSMVKSNEASQAYMTFEEECRQYDGYPKLTAHSKVKPPESPVVTPPSKNCKPGFFRKCKK